MDRLAERRRRARERVLKHYKTAFATPFWKAYVAHENSLEHLATRSMDFKQGVFMADPRGRWCKRFNHVDNELMKQFGVPPIGEWQHE